jgi:hypothetical protein
MRSAGKAQCFRSVGAALLFAAICGPGAPAGAHDPDVSVFGAGTAVVDGVMSPGEWDNAGQITFPVNLPASTGGGTTPATLYVMNDTDNLYLALRVQRASLDRSSVGFEFDNDHDGIREAGDDAIHLNGSPNFPSAFFDSFRGPCAGDPPGSLTCADNDNQVGATNDGQGAAANDGTDSVYELSHPLDSGDDPHDFSLGAGDVVGFQVWVRFIVGGWPEGFGDTYFPTDYVLNAHEFGDIIITPIPSAIDIKPGSAQNKIKLSSQGVVPVAILSTSTFSAPTEIDPATLTFGRTGNEASLSQYAIEDVNQDGLLDLIVHFNTQLTGFQPGDTVGTLKGLRTDGTPFVGTDAVQITP